MAQPNKNRKVEKTINLKGGNRLTYERPIDSNWFLKGNWYRNGKLITDAGLNRYSFVDKDGVRRVLTDTGYIEGQQINKLRKLERDSDKGVGIDATKSQPYSGKLITLHTKGRMNLATIPSNMLDSILVSTGRAGTDIKSNLGLVGKENTFGGLSIPIRRAMRKKVEGSKYDEKEIQNELKNSTWSKVSLTNNHMFSFTPLGNYYAYIRSKHPESVIGTKETENLIKYDLEHDIPKKHAVPIYYPSDILADSFIRYATNPKGYNPGQKNYQSMVNTIGEEVYNEPQIKAYINSSHGQQMIKKGVSERNRKTLGGIY